MNAHEDSGSDAIPSLWGVAFLGVTRESPREKNRRDYHSSNWGRGIDPLPTKSHYVVVRSSDDLEAL